MASKKQLLDDSERMIPSIHNRTIMYAEHVTRYRAAVDIAKDKVVLDIASGSGYGTKMLSEVSKKVYGVDVSEDAIEYAKQNYSSKNIEYIVGSAEKIPLPDKSIDLVITFETLEHVKNYRKFLDEIKRVLKDDGLAIISTPNDEEFAEGNHFHLHEFRLNELTNLLKKRFNHLKPYHQATWAYAQISDSDFIDTDGSIADVEVHNFSPLKSSQYLYFYILCSNREIKESIKNIGGLGGHYSARELGDIFQHYKKQIEDHKIVYANEQEAHRRTQIKLMMREGENHAITTSLSYRIAKTVAKPKHVAKLVVNHAKRLNPRHIKHTVTNNKKVKNGYNSKLFLDAFKNTASSDTAVIIHLYYPELLPYFVKKLKNLAHIKYDLYVTITEKDKKDVDKILKTLPQARVAVVPNCGRDVLPFVQVAKNISDHGYSKILKLHSKKSPHRSDGAEWRDKIVDSLLPGDPQIIDKALNKLNEKNISIIGPKGEYVSLLVNLSATAHINKSLAEKITGKKSAEHLMRHPDEYGFFGGTMFWARLDALMPVIETISISDFEPELGQQDTTMAHALERLLNVIPELQNKDVYEMSPNSLEVISYKTSNIPEWSEYSLKKSSS